MYHAEGDCDEYNYISRVNHVECNWDEYIYLECTIFSVIVMSTRILSAPCSV